MTVIRTAISLPVAYLKEVNRLKLYTISTLLILFNKIRSVPLLAGIDSG